MEQEYDRLASLLLKRIREKGRRNRWERILSEIDEQTRWKKTQTQKTFEEIRTERHVPDYGN